MKQSGLADSPFFAVPAKPAVVAPVAPRPGSAEVQAVGKRASGGTLAVKNEPGNEDTMQASMHASKNASTHATMDESIVESIRKAVKEVGKESATFRFTPEEKRALLEVAFTYKVQGYKTSENELTRIAVRFILEDHQQNGRNSILEKVLQALSK